MQESSALAEIEREKGKKDLLGGEIAQAFFTVLSGKEAASLSPPPLRTAREPFDSSRSSLSNALLGTRFRYSQTKAVNLPVTNWM